MSPKLVPLGGLGEFGANSMLLDAGEDGRLLLDAGAAFSGQAPLGVAFEVPDFAALQRRRPRAVVLSHSHDDHLKGLLWVQEAFPEVEVVASRHTLASRPPVLARGLDAAVRVLESGKPATLGSWVVDALPVSHSVPGTLALRVRGPGGTLVVLSDLRLAASALQEETDSATLARWGDEGVDLALLDATNALVAQEPAAESTVASTVSELVRAARGAVVIVTFASHLGRFHQATQAAAAAGRSVVPAGRGLLDALAVQAREGGPRHHVGLVRPLRELPTLPRDRVMVVATGSQGERGSAFHRLAFDLLPGLRLRPGDLVLHAARIIPGSERLVADLLDQCVRRGARVVTASEAPIHASGHPHQRELVELLGLVRPRVVLPVHGRRRNLEAVATLAGSVGVRAVVAENLQELEWDGASVEPTGNTLPVGRIQLDDVRGARLDPLAVRQRRAVARDGLVAVVLRGSRIKGELPGAVKVLHWGLQDGAGLVDKVERDLTAELRSRPGVTSSEPEVLRSTIAAWLRKELRRVGGDRPLCDVIVLEDQA